MKAAVCGSRAPGGDLGASEAPIQARGANAPASERARVRCCMPRVASGGV